MVSNNLRTLGNDMLDGKLVGSVYSHDVSTDETPTGPYLVVGPLTPVYWPDNIRPGKAGVRTVLVGVIPLGDLTPAKYDLATLLGDQRTQPNERDLTSEQRRLLESRGIL